jgi:hypothetical protein
LNYSPLHAGITHQRCHQPLLGKQIVFHKVLKPPLVQ